MYTKFAIVLVLILFNNLRQTFAIYCYECTGGRQDQTCGHYVGTSCEYGLFGCVKIATYSGGVDKMGNFMNDPHNIVSMVRGCNLLPVGGVDACQQQVILGLRVITCYCYSDYCNAAPPKVFRKYLQVKMIILLFMNFILIKFFNWF